MARLSARRRRRFFYERHCVVRHDAAAIELLPRPLPRWSASSAASRNPGAWRRPGRLADCAGRDAQPVAVARAGDEQLTCAQIDDEVAEIPRVKRLSNDSGKLGRNAGVPAVGAILF